MIRTIIIEDIEEHRRLLREMLQEYDDIDLLDEYENAEQGLKGIEKHSPDLVFLDVEMPPGMNGLDMLATIPSKERNFGIVFTTMHDQYALQAIEMACLHYLEKPIEKEKLAIALDKHRERADLEFRAAQNDILDSYSSQHRRPNFKMGISTMVDDSKKMTIIDVRDIIYCKASGGRGENYTHFYLKDGTYMMASKNLGYYIKLLRPYDHLVQTHRSFMVNIEFARSFNGKELTMEMEGYSKEVNRDVPVSSSRKRILETYLPS